MSERRPPKENAASGCLTVGGIVLFVGLVMVFWYAALALVAIAIAILVALVLGRRTRRRARRAEAESGDAADGPAPGLSRARRAARPSRRR